MSQHTTRGRSARLVFKKDADDSVNGEHLGTIAFFGDNSTPASMSFAEITGQISNVTTTDEAGMLTLSVAESDGTTSHMSPGLILEGEEGTDGEVDVTIANGVGSLTTIQGDLTVVGDVIKMTNLPTSDPAVAGQLWSNSGVLTISSG